MKMSHKTSRTKMFAKIEDFLIIQEEEKYKKGQN